MIPQLGTHVELLHARGHYYRLYTEQFRQERAVESESFGSALPTVAQSLTGKT